MRSFVFLPDKCTDEERRQYCYKGSVATGLNIFGVSVL